MKKVLRLTESELIKLVNQVIQEQNILNYKSNTEECFVLDFYFEKTTGGETNVNGDKEWGGGDLYFWNDNKIPEVDDEKAYNRFIEHIKDIAEYDGKGGLNNPEMILNEDCFDYDNVPSWKELLPYIKEAYYNTLRKKKLESQILSLQSPKDAISLAKQMFAGKSEDKLTDIVNRLSKKYNVDIPLQIKRRLSDSVLVAQINKEIDLMGPNELDLFDDPYDYADNILEKVIDNNYYSFFNSLPNEDNGYEMHEEFLDYIKDNFADIILDYWADIKGFDFE